jgi:FkbM family methyltransferase
VQEALRRTIAPGACIYDVGANVGFFSAFAARLAGPGGHVVAFEPVAAVAAIAHETAQRSDLADRIDVRAQAVGADEGSVRMHVVARGGVWSHVADRHPHPETVATIDVPQTTLDAVVAAGERPPDVIKLDVEGAEVAVLRGAAHVLAAHRPAIVCELHGTNAEVADLLEDAGYALESLDSAGAMRDAGPSHVVARPTASS